MAMKQLMLPGEIVKKSNALARARWSAESVWEPRLVALLASKVRQDDTDFQVYEIPVGEIMRGSTGGKDYREVESVVDRVMSRVLTIRDDKGWTKYNVFSRCRYRAKDAVLELGFHPDLRPHYLNLQKHFAQYNLLEYLTLPSIYSQRMFEFLKSWDDKPEISIPIDELYDMLDAPASFRKDFRNFRLRVLEKAYKDIHNKTSFEYEWEPIKRGKSVASIRFIFSSGKKNIAIKEKKSVREQKQSHENNKYFLEAVTCFKAGKCDYQPKSKKCIICKTSRISTRGERTT